jgi:hypothetical protein
MDQDSQRREDRVLRQQFTPAPGPLGDRLWMDFEISGHGRDPLLAIKQATERIEPIDRAGWNPALPPRRRS